MSTARTLSIHKAATELVQELLNASSESGGERWFHIIVRKMEALPDREPPRRPDFKIGLRFPGVRFDRNFATGGVDIAQTDRARRMTDHGYEGPEFDAASVSLSEEQTTKLRLWLNGEKQ